MPSTQNGSSFAAMNCPRVIGVTFSCSSVPSSFSRAMFCALSKRADQRDERDQNSRHHVVLVVERRVVPAPDADIDQRRTTDRRRRTFANVRAARRSRRVRPRTRRRCSTHTPARCRRPILLRVDGQLDRRRAAAADRSFEVVRDRQHHRHVAAQQRFIRQIGRRRLLLDPEVPGRARTASTRPRDRLERSKSTT